MFDMQVLADEIAAIIADEVSKATRPLVERIAVLEAMTATKAIAAVQEGLSDV